MKKFWSWFRDEVSGQDTVLRIDGPIDDEMFWGDEATPNALAEELNSRTGDITVWIDSPGGNVFAAAKMYNLLKEYKGKVTVKIDSLAASAASVVAMAGDEVFMSPVAMFMIHNPWTIAMGNEKDMQEAINTLRAVKDAVINAYAAKTGKSKKAISSLMDGDNGEGTWMDAKKALANGFIDKILYSDDKDEDQDKPLIPEQEKPEEDEEDDAIKNAKAAAKRKYSNFIQNTIRFAHNGNIVSNNSRADEENVVEESSTEDNGDETEPLDCDVETVDSAELEQEEKLVEDSVETESETNEEVTEEVSEKNSEEESDTPTDKILMPKHVFDENGMTSDGKMSYNILVDKLNSLR